MPLQTSLHEDVLRQLGSQFQGLAHSLKPSWMNTLDQPLTRLSIEAVIDRSILISMQMERLNEDLGRLRALNILEK